jgi:transketolase
METAIDTKEAAVDLIAKARQIRRMDLEMICASGLGHIGGDFSAAEILATLYGGVLKIDPKNPRDPQRDRFILSKGHASGILYATLAQAGFFPIEDLSTFMQPLSMLNGHPDRNKVPGVEANTGPLGHGMPIAVGCALAAKMDKASWRVFILTGDGELQEGTNWEAAMAAAHFKLDNLILTIDRNRFQQGGATESTVHLESLADKWRSFGWAVREADGHDPVSLLEAYSAIPFKEGCPNCLIAHTHKGHGVSFMSDNPIWHHKVPNKEEKIAALAELGEEKQ